LRLNKYIAHNSSYSRREADRLIFDGKVKINNRVVVEPAIDVTDEMKISINNRYLKKREDYTFIVYNKPKGELVTKSDPRGRKTIYHSLGGKYRGFSPVGRLDYASEGVLILSDAIDIVDKLMKSPLERVYKIKLNGAVTKALISAMEQGIQIENSTAGAHEYSDITNMEIKPFNWFKILKSGRNYSILKVSISEGKNRELRRFFANFHLDVLDLKRVSYGWVNLNALPTGKKRFFTTEEYDEMRKYIKSIGKSETKELKKESKEEEKGK
jgi:23S rRNA pseudouridine2605 synthase